MFNIRSKKRRSKTSAVRTRATVEHLEDKRLLSATAVGAQQNEETLAVAILEGTPDVFRLQQEVSDPGYSLKFEEIRVVADEVWILSEFQRLPGGWIQVVSTAGDTVAVDVPDLPVRHFRIGGGDGFPPDTEVTAVRNRDEFYELIGDSPTQLLYDRVDPELAAWRQSVQSEIIDQADGLYVERFGQEAAKPIYYYHGVAVDDIAFVSIAAERSSSDTNVQVAGVDEGDIVETDGEFIYTISGREIVIVRAATAESDGEVVSRTEFSEIPVAMFLANDRLTVISQEYGQVPWLRSGLWATPSASRTVVTVLDVGDKQAPALVQESIVDGRYQAARAVGDQVYVVVTNNEGIPYVPELNTVYDGSLVSKFRFETREEYLQRVDRLVNGGTVQDGLRPPSVYIRGAGTTDQQSLERLGWLDGADRVSPNDGQLTSVLQFDTTSRDSTPVSNIGVNTRRYGATQIYASTTALYLVTEEYNFTENSDIDDGDDEGLIDSIVVPPTSVESRIHKIGLETGKLVPEGEGSVPGNVESQFSIDEHNGYLRVVTTTGNNWWWNGRSSQNHLYILEDRGDTLEQVGSVEDLAAGERIYAARFDGDRAWMVTFRQTDPVFSFDLSDPTDPKVTGELKIPGYSDHLQLIDENHLLAIGRNATEAGRVQEVQVSLFDVSDMASPQLLHRYSMASDVYGHSEALQDHLAFNYLPDSKLLAVPFGNYGQQGMVLLSVDVEDGFELAGQIKADPHVEFRWDSENSYRRSVQVGEHLYAVSTASIRAVNLNDPDTVVQTLKLQEDKTPPHPILELQIEIGPEQDILRLTELLGEDGTAEELRLALDELFQGALPDPDEIEEYEFRVLDRTNGDEILRQAAATPEILLMDDSGSPLDSGTYDVQFRTKLNRLQQPEFGAWSVPTALSVRSEAAEMISENVLRAGQRLLEWSRISDRLTMSENGTDTVTNAVDHYEVWISDASSGERVVFNRDVARPELLLDLEAGGYFAWFRAIYTDGNQRGWSLRDRFEILGDKLQNLISPGLTADRSPTFALPNLSNAESFEIELTDPDGTVTTHAATDPRSLRHEIADELATGQYSFRLRAHLSSGVPTEWSDSVAFIIVGRPTIGVNGRQLQLFSGAAEKVEIWVNKAGTNERVFHDTDFQAITVDDAIAELGLDANYLSGYDVWTRFTMADGSRTPWGDKAVVNSQLATVVSVHALSAFEDTDEQSISWDAGEGIESFEIWISKVGESGVHRRIHDVTGLSYRFEDKLPEGNYKAWVRGKLINGLHTIWGAANSFVVANRPVLTVENEIATWTIAGEIDPSDRFELWVNQIDENDSLVSAKVIHEADLSNNTFDLSSLGENGRYRSWVRRITTDGDNIFRSVWSHGVTIQTAAADVTTAFNDGLDVVLSALDTI